MLYPEFAHLGFAPTSHFGGGINTRAAQGPFEETALDDVGV